MNYLMLASPCKLRLSSLKKSLESFINAGLLKDKLVTEGLEVLRDEIAHSKPTVLLMDIELLGLNESHDVISLRSLCAETKIIILSNNISEELEWDLLKAGIRGCCPNNLEPKLLKQVVMTVEQGELWIRRSLTSRLIDELSKTSSKNKAYRATLGLLNKLTQREYDIAVRVGNGESNKVIAAACGIAERTVKTHLTEIFQKLEVADRLNLALILVADNRIATSIFSGKIKEESFVNETRATSSQRKIHQAFDF